jgi:hypothetical protein
VYITLVFQDSKGKFEEGELKGKKKYEKNAKKIVDEQVKNIVLKHISNYSSVKEAFNTEHLALLKLGNKIIFIYKRPSKLC